MSTERDTSGQPWFDANARVTEWHAGMPTAAKRWVNWASPPDETPEQYEARLREQTRREGESDDAYDERAKAWVP